jgi:hypothetical protein
MILYGTLQQGAGVEQVAEDVQTEDGDGGPGLQYQLIEYMSYHQVASSLATQTPQRTVTLQNQRMRATTVRTALRVASGCQGYCRASWLCCEEVPVVGGAGVAGVVLLRQQAAEGWDAS